METGLYNSRNCSVSSRSEARAGRRVVSRAMHSPFQGEGGPLAVVEVSRCHALLLQLCDAEKTIPPGDCETQHRSAGTKPLIRRLRRHLLPKGAKAWSNVMFFRGDTAGRCGHRPLRSKTLRDRGVTGRTRRVTGQGSSFRAFSRNGSAVTELLQSLKIRRF